MLERNITIREIEEKDKASYLNLFNSESFGCIGTQIKNHLSMQKSRF